MGHPLHAQRAGWAGVPLDAATPPPPKSCRSWGSPGHRPPCTERVEPGLGFGAGAPLRSSREGGYRSPRSDAGSGVKDEHTPPPPFFSPCSPAPAPNYRVQSRCLINDSLINGCPITGSDTSTLLMVENQFPVRGGGGAPFKQGASRPPITPQSLRKGVRSPEPPHASRGASGHPPFISAAGMGGGVPCPRGGGGWKEDDTHPVPGRGGPRAAGRGAGGSSSA